MAVLGHAHTYAAAFYAQGGTRLFTRVERGLTEVSWGRKLDDYSEAAITVTKEEAGTLCCDRLGDVHTWGHELALFRDGALVWIGPVTDKSEFRGRFEFKARDMLAWLDRRKNHRIYNHAPATDDNPGGDGPKDPGHLISSLVRDAFATEPIPSDPDFTPIAEHDPGLFEHCTIEARWQGPGDPNESPTAITWQALDLFATTVGDAVRDCVSHGMDMFTVGRQIVILPEERSRSNIPHRLAEHDFLGDLEVRELGLDLTTRACVVGAPEEGMTEDGEPAPAPVPPPRPPIGTVPGVPVGASDPSTWVDDPDDPDARHPNWGPRPGEVEPVDAFYGLIERGTTSQNARDQDAVDSLAHMLWRTSYPAPVAVIVPDGTQLSPNAPITIEQLVPARRVHIELASYCTPVTSTFVINELEVTASSTQDGMTERVQISLASEGFSRSIEGDRS